VSQTKPCLVAEGRKGNVGAGRAAFRSGVTAGRPAWSQREKMAVPQTTDTKREPVYEELRPLLFSIAYQMVGSTSDAEDIVQKAFLRFHRDSLRAEGNSLRAEGTIS
jgi:hypothetical protein